MNRSSSRNTRRRRSDTRGWSEGEVGAKRSETQSKGEGRGAPRVEGKAVRGKAIDETERKGERSRKHK